MQAPTVKELARAVMEMFRLKDRYNQHHDLRDHDRLLECENDVYRMCVQATRTTEADRTR